jgi:hypothetical protein
MEYLEITWLERIYKDQALGSHSARVRELQNLRGRNNWPAYWQAADAQFKNLHQIPEKSCNLG